MMKLVQLYTTILIIVLFTPQIFTIIVEHSRAAEAYKVYENAPEERQREKNNSEGKESATDAEEFTFHQKLYLNIFPEATENQLYHNKMSNFLFCEIIHPPPKFL